MAACPRPGVPPRLDAPAPPRAAWHGVPPWLGAALLPPSFPRPRSPCPPSARGLAPALSGLGGSPAWRARSIPGAAAPTSAWPAMAPPSLALVPLGAAPARSPFPVPAPLPPLLGAAARPRGPAPAARPPSPTCASAPAPPRGGAACPAPARRAPPPRRGALLRRGVPRPARRAPLPRSRHGLALSPCPSHGGPTSPAMVHGHGVAPAARLPRRAPPLPGAATACRPSAALSSARSY
eukprot:XP_020401819.1 vegetative cell wall protein gp1-like [Zea mays]